MASCARVRSPGSASRAVLTYSTNSSGYSSHELQLQGIENPTLVQFPRLICSNHPTLTTLHCARNTQKCLIVAAESSLHMYDVVRHKLSKSFSLKSRVSAVTVNYCDAYIAAGCEDGSVQLATVASNQVSAPMVVPRCVGQKITSVRYNVIKVEIKMDFDNVN